MKLTAILATRGRPQLLLRTLERTLANIARPETRIVVAIDDDEPTAADAAWNAPVWRDPRVIKAVAAREDTLGEKYNARLGVAPADVYLAMVDYAPHVTPAFDEKILAAAALFPDGVGVVLNRLANLSFTEINAVTHRMAEIAGGFYPGYFPYWFVDHWFQDIAEMIGRLAYADVAIDTSKRPGTMGRWEPAFWGSLFTALEGERRSIAERLLAAMDEPDWRKAMLRTAWGPRIETRSRMLNEGSVAKIPSAVGEPDARYQRARARALPILQAHRQSALAAQLDRPYGQQDRKELNWFLASIKGAKSLLEIGSGFGRTLLQAGDVLAPGARIRSIDLGRSDDIDTAPALQAVIARLRAKGLDADLLLADSAADLSVAWAAAAAPYDVVFIDGDPSYEAVRRDWERYGPMARVVALHNVANPSLGASRLWREIAAAGHNLHACVHSSMGIGVVVMPRPADLARQLRRAAAGAAQPSPAPPTSKAS
jgi:predicted O-methyltransferase YrrM